MPFLSQFNGIGTTIFFEAIHGMYDRIGPVVRAVSISYNGDLDIFYLNIYSEKPLCYKEREEFDLAASEMVNSPLYGIWARFFVVPLSEKLVPEGDLFYKRKEKQEKISIAPKPPENLLLLGTELMQEIIIKISQALLARIVPRVRAIIIDYDKEKKNIALLIYSERELEEEDSQDFAQAAADASSQISTKLPVVAQFFVRPMLERFPIAGHLIYYRYEPFPDELPKESYTRPDEWHGVKMNLLAKFDGFGRDIFFQTMRGLFHHIREEIRAVSMSYNDNTRVFYLNVYSEPTKADCKRLFEIVASEISSDLVIAVPIEARLFWVPMSQELVTEGDLIFKRKETY